MTTQIHTQKTAQDRPTDTPSPTTPIAQPSAQKLSSDVEDLLYEIDDLLEENAEAFVAAFVQLGGE